MKLREIFQQILEDLYKRRDMPQISGDQIGKAINVMKSEGIEVSVETVFPRNLKHAQKWINKNKVEEIKKQIMNGESMPPIIISLDKYIVDGHHRQVAYKEIKPNERLRVIMIHLTKDEAIEAYKQVEGKL